MDEYDAPAGWSPPEPPPPAIEISSHGDTPLGLCLEQPLVGFSRVLKTEKGFHPATLLLEVMRESKSEYVSDARLGIILDRTGMIALRDLLHEALIDGT